jgi:proteasome beta subunit
MTIILALRCRDGVVLAADSQRTEGTLREPFPKLFTSPSGIVWGTAGSIAIQQELYPAIQALSVPRNPRSREAKEAIVEAIAGARTRATGSIVEPSADLVALDGLFAWYSADDHRTFILRVWGNVQAEFARQYAAVGSPSDKARFALSRSEHFEFRTLPIEPAKVIAFLAAEDVIHATPSGVALPVQMAVVTGTGSAVLSDDETRALRDTAAAFRESQRELLVREEKGRPPADTGIRPT